jgi:adenosine deaminase
MAVGLFEHLPKNEEPRLVGREAQKYGINETFRENQLP